MMVDLLRDKGDCLNSKKDMHPRRGNWENEKPTGLEFLFQTGLFEQ